MTNRAERRRSEKIGVPVLPPAAREKIRDYLAQSQQINQQLQAYVAGFADTMGIDINEWVLQVDTMTFAHKKNGKKPEKEPEAEA